MLTSLISGKLQLKNSLIQLSFAIVVFFWEMIRIKSRLP